MEEKVADEFAAHCEKCPICHADSTSPDPEVCEFWYWYQRRWHHREFWFGWHSPQF